MRKKEAIKDLRALVKSSVNTAEFILHFPKTFDMRLQAEDRDTLFNLVNLRFAKLMPSITLKVFKVPVPSLKEFHTTPSNKKYGIEVLPSDEFRQREEEI